VSIDSVSIEKRGRHSAVSRGVCGWPIWEFPRDLRCFALLKDANRYQPLHIESRHRR
jgi:hypothetical protein